MRERPERKDPAEWRETLTRLQTEAATAKAAKEQAQRDAERKISSEERIAVANDFKGLLEQVGNLHAGRVPFFRRRYNVYSGSVFWDRALGAVHSMNESEKSEAVWRRFEADLPELVRKAQKKIKKMQPPGGQHGL